MIDNIVIPPLDDFYTGIDANSEGLSIAAEWNLANAEVSYLDDNRRVVFSGIQSHGTGDLTFDVRDQSIGIGMTNFTGSYSVEGLRVGNKNSPIQGGAELLLSLEVFQAMDFNLNGYTQVKAGGASGGGVRLDGNYTFVDSNFGLSLDENSEGVWATDVFYDLRLRDVTVDVKNDGVLITKGEVYSWMDINNLRWGNKDTGRSLGRVQLSRFEKGSSLEIQPGGAGAVCVGASGGDASACSTNGGRWEDRGNQGITVSLKNIYADAGVPSSSHPDWPLWGNNSLTWENNRDNGAWGTGTQIIFSNFSTNDGLGTSDSNNYGLQANLNIDVYETKVLKKTAGADVNGVTGSIGDELIYDSSDRDTYSYVTNPTAAQIENRPLGFAVQGNVSFKELHVDAIQLKHPDVTTPQNVVYGAVLQNLNLTTNLTATPIQ